MRLILNHIQNAHESLRANRMRTFLTITGVAIGIASIIAILTLTTSASRVVGQQIDGVGGNIIVVRPGTSDSRSFSDFINQQTHGGVGYSTLTEKDMAEISQLDTVSAIAPLMLSTATVAGDSNEEASIIGTSPSLLEISQVSLRDGDFADENQPLVTIGSQLSIDLFGTEDSLGKTVTIRGQSLRVNGVLERQRNPVNFNGIDFNQSAFITQDQFIGMHTVTPIQQITIQVDSVANLDRTVIEINKLLLKLHSGEQDFQVLTGDDIAAPTGQLFSVVAGVAAAIAGISLFVGGIGIMNIMLVNVAERTREIGIRKALGATHGDIVWQFLIESIIMALVGGIAGYIIGLLVAFIGSLFLPFNPTITWQVAVISIGVSGLVGIIFGLYPAIRAARKTPIESLTQPH